jgi:hypothetical protein
MKPSLKTIEALKKMAEQPVSIDTVSVQEPTTEPEEVNYENFTQVVILDNAAHTPFMEMKTTDRREFIEHVLDIGLLDLQQAQAKETPVQKS